MATINNTITRLGIMDVADSIIADAVCGANQAHLILGPPGTAKTSIGQYIADSLTRIMATDYQLVFLDMQTLDPADLAIPMPDPESKTFAYWFNEVFGFTPDQPVVLLIDEYSKPQNPASQNAVHQLFSKDKKTGCRRLLSMMLHPDSVIIGTGNLGTDGVGDMVKSHTRNKVTMHYVRNPYPDEWLPWAFANNIHPIVQGWVKQTPMCFASYLDPDFGSLPEDIKSMVYNPDPKNPAREQGCVTARSLEFASNVFHAYFNAQAMGLRYTEQMLLADLQGVIGNQAARSMLVFKNFAMELPSAKQIMAGTAAYPTSIAAHIICALNACVWITGAGYGLTAPETKLDVKNRISGWFNYMMGGLAPDAQTMFVHSVKDAAEKAARKQETTVMSKLWDLTVTTHEFQKWASVNGFKY